jgi:hypothetical protein
MTYLGSNVERKYDGEEKRNICNKLTSIVSFSHKEYHEKLR